MDPLTTHTQEQRRTYRVLEVDNGVRVKGIRSSRGVLSIRWISRTYWRKA